MTWLFVNGNFVTVKHTTVTTIEDKPKKPRPPRDERDLDLLNIAERFPDEDSARKFFEAMLWEDGIPVCPHCGCFGAYEIKPKPGSRRPVKPGTWKCKSCRKYFTVRVGTILEGSHVPYRKWIMVYFLFVTSKKSVSAHWIHRTLRVKKTTAWHMLHRIREAMTYNELSQLLDGDVEVDEVYIGGDPRAYEKGIKGKGTKKTPVIVAVSRQSKEARAQVLPDQEKETFHQFIKENVSQSARILTDSNPSYYGIGKYFERGHETVTHSNNEYVRGDIYTNTVESFNGLYKRAYNGAWHHVSKEHLFRYLTEFIFRWTNRERTDNERMRLVIKRSAGKRLTYNKLKARNVVLSFNGSKLVRLRKET